MVFATFFYLCYNFNESLGGITMQEFLTEYKEIIAVLALVGIEILPVKISPFTWLGKICSKLLGIEELNKKINDIDKKVDENERDRIRYEILQFAGSLRNGLERTENDYTHIEELYEKYHDKMKCNSYITSEMKFIRENKNMVDK